MTRDDETRFMVRCDQTGDTAECGSPEAALLAARTLMDDAYEANPVRGYKPTVTFFTDGFAVRHAVSYADVLSCMTREA